MSYRNYSNHQDTNRYGQSPTYQTAAYGTAQKESTSTQPYSGGRGLPRRKSMGMFELIGDNNQGGNNIYDNVPNTLQSSSNTMPTTMPYQGSRERLPMGQSLDRQTQRVPMTEQRARRLIFEALVFNHELKKAIRRRILDQTTKSAILIARFLKKLKQRRELRRRRQLGIFKATLYLIPKEHERVKPKW